MLSKILLAAFNQNLLDEDIHRIFLVHKRLQLCQADLDEWMRCFEESLDQIGLEGVNRRLLTDKVRIIGTYLMVRKSENGSVDSTAAGDMVDELISDIYDENHVYCGCDLIERLKAIRDSI